MPKPTPKTALRKAPGREHPVAPAPAPTSSTPAKASIPPTAQETSPLAMFSVRLDQGLRRQVRLHAAEQEVSMQELVTKALTEYLERHRTG